MIRIETFFLSMESKFPYIKTNVLYFADNPKKTSLPTTPKLIDDPIVAAYKRLGIESIAAALRTMRYAVGPKHKMLAVSN